MMKGSDLILEGCELQHKVRTVNDLIRHIRTRESDNEIANYNLFFGAGCSVTSKIRPAKLLIDEWLYDLYERFESKRPRSVEEAKEYFEKNYSSWYSKDNPYSSLFEKTYEFASQRRRFVEKEVDKKLPAIGYAYLTSLVSNRYFNTIFTTNFDDLINEAFYQFSNERPILCAHDSSIKSISITSKRPKIIKLHGDYLFDDIKSTVRETESLEQNTKEKMIEFCKEFGLVVVGYSGNDRSVMDVLDFLTKQENYLKNGVYWCLRKDDEVNHSLQKLFWKDKVYPVLIDGFDELFAEIHAKAIGSGLNIEESINNSKLQKIKYKIIEESASLSSNEFIRKDVENINASNNRQEISKLLSELNDSGESQSLSLSELRDILEVEGMINRSEFEKSYLLAEDFYKQAEKFRDKARFVSMLITISERKGDISNCLYWCDKLIGLDPNNIKYIVKRSFYIKELAEKYKYLSSELIKYDFSYKLYNSAISVGFDLMKHSPSSSLVVEEKLLEYVEKSLKLNPSLMNKAWYLKYNILSASREKYRLERYKNKKNVEDIDSSIINHIEKSKMVNEKSLVYLNLNLSFFILKNDFDGVMGVIDSLYTVYELAPYNSKVSVNEILNKAVKSFRDGEDLEKICRFERSFYRDHLVDEDIKENSELLLSKGVYCISHREFKKAEEYFLLAIDCDDVLENYHEAIFLNNCLDGKYREKLLDHLVANKSKMVDRYYYEVKYELLKEAGDYDGSLECLKYSFNNGMSLKDYYSNMSYLMVIFEKYEELLAVGIKHEKEIGLVDSDTFRINFNYAAKSVGSNKFNKVELRNIVARTNSPGVRVAVFSILDQDSDVRVILNKQIKKSYYYYYFYLRWPIVSKEILSQAVIE